MGADGTMRAVSGQSAHRRAHRYGSRPTNGRRRRTKAEIQSLRDDLLSIIATDPPMTVRQVYYQAVTQGLIDKTEAAYKNVVIRLLGEMRRDHDLPYDWIADNTRWMRKPHTWSSMESLLQNTARTYRRSLWDDQDAYVEIWLEKEALAGVLYRETEAWDVPLMVTRGYPSLSFLHSAAETIEQQCCDPLRPFCGKDVYLYYFGDYDPSGLDISRAVQEGIEQMTDGADFTFTRVAVTEEQIIDLNLPTRPTKRTDSRAKNFIGESVEVDAIPPATLRDLVRECIEAHVDDHALVATQKVETEEREAMEQFAAAWSNGHRKKRQ